MLAFPAKNLEIFPRNHLGDLLICGIENRIDPCFGGGAPLLCAAIAALAPSTCREPDGMRANRSLVPARTINLEADNGPIKALRQGKYELASSLIAVSCSEIVWKT